MADTRINALSTASSSASDDYVPIDGTTNGTRKLSAYSPTFGGNATVGGILTVTGAIAANGGATINVGGFTQTQTGNEIRFSRNGFNYVFLDGGTSANLRFNGTTSTAGDTSILNLSNTQVAVLPTTASTSTITGALVVGNGTSGGLGVGGSVNVGGSLTVSGTGTSTFAGSVTVRRDQAGVTGLIVDNQNTGGTTNLFLTEDGGSTNYFRIYRSGSTTGTPNVVNISNIVGGSASTTAIEFGSPVKALSTTASTSTSSGALVVSGGVGVAGSQYLGVKLNISTHDSSAGGIGFGTETNLYRYQAGGLALDHASGAAPGFLFRENGTSTLRLESNSGVGYLSTLTAANLILRTNATTALTLDTSQNAIFAGTVRTAAPVGGTAASWKLGSVATVSPTSPNRTIEVDIGGTIYYIHAKTTNN